MANGHAAANPPPSALIASAFSPTPLAPRLTTPSTPQSDDESVTAAAQPTISPFASINAIASSSSVRNAGDHAVLSNTNISVNGIPPRPRATSINAHRLLQRSNQPTATQALNVMSTHSTSPFPAYLHSRRSLYKGGSLGSLPMNDTEDGQASMPTDKLLDARLRHSGSQPLPSFSIIDQFRDDCEYRGDILVRCSAFDFYVHRSILYFASPFFRAILDGDWQENHPSLYADSTIPATSCIDEPVHEHDATLTLEAPSVSLETAADRTSQAQEDVVAEAADESDQADSQHSVDEEDVADRLSRMATPPLPDDRQAEFTSANNRDLDAYMQACETQEAVSIRRRRRMDSVSAVIDLSEEDASIFQDVLCHIYPNLDLVVTWLNIFSLFSLSDKYAIPYLRRSCTTFLRASLDGRPIEAMALAERHGIDDVYREASRHVLDNMPSWTHDELAVLTSDTLLKLERKRTWFLERLLKLGLANPARDYECHATCPDQNHCAKTLHDRWHAQYAAAFKYGPPQPSIIWRHLRELDGIGVPSTGATMSACQSSSKAWVQSLFDRMYGLPSHGKATQKFLAIRLGQEDLSVRSRSRLFESEL